MSIPSFSSVIFDIVFSLISKLCSYHLIGNHSLHVSRFAIQLDYLGIVILRLGSTIPSVYYGFYCNPNIQKAYMTNVSYPCLLTRYDFSLRAHLIQAFATATFAIIATFQPRFHHPTVRSYRVTVYGGLGLLANIFVIHGVLLHGWAEQNQRMSIDYMGLMALLTIIGGVIYVARVRFSLHPAFFFASSLLTRRLLHSSE